MKKLVAIAVLGLLTICASAKKIQTIVYTPNPKMVCENCEKKIKDTLRFIKGTKKIETDLKNQTITITFDAEKTSKDAYEKALKKIGREVKEASAPTQSTAKAASK